MVCKYKKYLYIYIYVCVFIFVCVCVCVCVSERERETVWRNVLQGKTESLLRIWCLLFSLLFASSLIYKPTYRFTERIIKRGCRIWQQYYD